jgi:hypothetical protein
VRHERYVSGLSKADPAPEQGIPDGVSLVRVERAQYRWHAQKPYFSILFLVLEPDQTRGRRFTARLSATAKALWKLNWFLRDFGYDAELLGRDEIDDKHLVGLSGVVKVSHTVVKGASLLSLDAFAPQERWLQLASETLQMNAPKQVAS